MITPLFISPEFGTEDVNARIEELMINNLPDGYESYILCKQECHSCDQIIRVPQDEKLKELENRYRTYIFSPDTYYYSWGKHAYKEIIERTKSQSIHFTYIHSFSIPYSCHLVANSLKKKLHIPWVAQFFEPWCDNPYNGVKKNFAYKAAMNYWERSVAKNADIIIHNSEAMKESWLTRYGDLVKNKMFVLRIPFDPSLLKAPVNLPTPQIITISHLGNLVGLRNAVSFIDSLVLLLDEEPSLRDKIHVNFIGKTMQSDIEHAKKKGLLDVITFIGPIPEVDCVKYYQESDLFLVIEGPDQGKLFFPSKIIKYFYYRKPILGLTQRGSVLDIELTRTHNYSFENNDTYGICRFLKSAVMNYPSICGNDESYWHNFAVDKINQDYSSMIKSYIHE